jgi:predicted nucleic acid binding AN1-type Zn finger protein
MTKTCLHCKAPFETDDYGVMPNSSCNCGGCYASKEELKDAIAWHTSQIKALQETVETIEELRELLGTLECQA